MSRGTSETDPLRRVLDERSAALVERVLAALAERRSRGGATGRQTVKQGIARLRTVWAAIEAFPPLGESQTLGQRHRDLHTLLDHFSRAEPYTLDTCLPTRATLARTYGMAKFNFFRMLGYVIEDRLAGDEAQKALLSEIALAGRAAAASLIAEDVLRSIACDDQLTRELRQMAVRLLAAFWDQRTTRSLADFTPLLDSAWRAKADVRIAYGTLAGISETLQMSSAGLDPEFLEYFADERLSLEQRWAFEEFLFNALHEELERMREHMAATGVSSLDADTVARLFDVDPAHLHSTTLTAEDLFFTFRDREHWARIRRMTGMEGPKKTAEEYVMIYVLGLRVREGV